MKILYISGSPRKRSNTDYLLDQMLNQTGGEFIKLSNYTIEPCYACWACLKEDSCIIKDDMGTIITTKILQADTLVIGSPVFFNNVTAQLKAFMDRTWSIRGNLRNKIGAAVVVGRRYGYEAAIMAIHSFFLKHEMIVANRGVSGIAFKPEEIKDDMEALEAAKKLTTRILELGTLVGEVK